MLDPQHRLDLRQDRHDTSFDRETFFRRALYHMEMIELRPQLRNAFSGGRTAALVLALVAAAAATVVVLFAMAISEVG